MKQSKYLLAALLQAIFIGFSFLFSKTAVADYSTLPLLAGRFTIAFITYTLILWVSGYRRQLSMKDYLHLIPLGLFYPLAFFGFQTLGLQFITSVESGLLFATTPIMTLIMARFILHESIRRHQLIAMALSVIGLIIIIGGKLQFSNTSLYGYSFTFLSVISISAYLTLQKKLIHHYPFQELVWFLLGFGFITTHSLALISHTLSPQGLHMLAYIKETAIMVLDSRLLYLGIAASVLSSFLTAYASKGLSASTMGLFPNLSTLISMIAGTLILHESLTYRHYIGACLIIIGLILASRSPKGVDTPLPHNSYGE